MVPVCNVAGVQLTIMQCVHQGRDTAWRYLLNKVSVNDNEFSCI